MLMCRLQATKTQNTGSSFAACCPLGPPPATAAGFIPQSYLGAFVGSLLLYGLTQKIKFCKFIPFSIPICFIVQGIVSIWAGQHGGHGTTGSQQPLGYGEEKSSPKMLLERALIL